MLAPHSDAWYDRLSTLQDSYFYPWESTLSPLNGEDEYLHLLADLVTPDMTVLDVGCGHGEVALWLAPQCKWVVAYDRTTAFIEKARTSAEIANLSNLSFIQADGVASLLTAADFPQHAHPFDLIISRRGPLHWVADVGQLGRVGTILFALNPKESQLPPWNERLPEPLRLANPRTTSRQQSVERRLAQAGLRLQSAWAIDVPEWFASPEQLYVKLSWGYTAEEVASFAEVEPILNAIFAEFGTEQGLAVPHGRFMWQAVVG